MERKGNLIKLTDLSSDFIIDLKYATPDNFTGVQVYQSADCWLDEHTAQILIKAKEIFEKDGYRVKIWDATALSVPRSVFGKLCQTTTSSPVRPT